MSIVVDASVAIKWVIPEAESDAAQALRTNELLAPDIWLTEAGNALWRHVWTGRMSREEAAERFTELASSPIGSVPTAPHLGAALGLAVDLGHPIYDCLYLAVALHRDTHVVTADRRFVAAASAVPALSERVRLLGSS